MDRLERNLLITVPVIFMISVIYLYIFAFMMSSGPASRIIQQYPWFVGILAWEMAVMISARAYLKAWDESYRRAGS